MPLRHSHPPFSPSVHNFLRKAAATDRYYGANFLNHVIPFLYHVIWQPRFPPELPKFPRSPPLDGAPLGPLPRTVPPAPSKRWSMIPIYYRTRVQRAVFHLKNSMLRNEMWKHLHALSLVSLTRSAAGRQPRRSSGGQVRGGAAAPAQRRASPLNEVTQTAQAPA